MSDTANMVLEIPLQAAPQSFPVYLASTQFRFTVTYRDAIGGGWILDIADQDDVSLIAGIPLVTGCDLLAQYAYVGIPGSLFVASDGPDTNLTPTFDNLGQTVHLYYVTP